jgi:hypothetical protein
MSMTMSSMMLLMLDLESRLCSCQLRASLPALELEEDCRKERIIVIHLGTEGFKKFGEMWSQLVHEILLVGFLTHLLQLLCLVISVQKRSSLSLLYL